MPAMAARNNYNLLYRSIREYLRIKKETELKNKIV